MIRRVPSGCFVTTVTADFSDRFRASRRRSPAPSLRVTIPSWPAAIEYALVSLRLPSLRVSEPAQRSVPTAVQRSRSLSLPPLPALVLVPTRTVSADGVGVGGPPPLFDEPPPPWLDAGGTDSPVPEIGTSRSVPPIVTAYFAVLAPGLVGDSRAFSLHVAPAASTVVAEHASGSATGSTSAAFGPVTVTAEITASTSPVLVMTVVAAAEC